MPIELHVENFQSWEKFDLMIEDLTVVVGPSNLGKSATQRALKGLIRNLLNLGQRRSGADTVSVSAVIDGRKYTASRTKKGSTVYEIEGVSEPYKKLDGAIPPEIENLNMGILELGGVKLDPIFAGQFGEQFLLQQGPQALNSVLGAFSSTEKLEAGKRTANGRIAEKNVQAKALAVEMREAEERRAKLAALVERADAIQSRIDLLEPFITHQERLVAALQTLIAHRQRLNAIELALSQATVPDLTPVAHGIRASAALHQAIEARTRYNVRQRAIDRIQIPDVAPVAHESQVLTAAGRAIETRTRFDRRQSAIDRLIVPDTAKAARLAGVSVASHNGARAMARLAAANQAMEAIAGVVARWSEIATTYKRMKTTGAAAQARRAQEQSRAASALARLDAHLATITLGIQGVKHSATGISQLAELQRATSSLGTIELQLKVVETGWTGAQEEVRLIQTQWEQHKQDAKKAGHALTCPNCGTAVSAATA